RTPVRGDRRQDQPAGDEQGPANDTTRSAGTAPLAGPGLGKIELAAGWLDAGWLDGWLAGWLDGGGWRLLAGWLARPDPISLYSCRHGRRPPQSQEAARSVPRPTATSRRPHGDRGRRRDDARAGARPAPFPPHRTSVRKPGPLPPPPPLPAPPTTPARGPARLRSRPPRLLVATPRGPAARRRRRRRAGAARLRFPTPRDLLVRTHGDPRTAAADDAPRAGAARAPSPPHRDLLVRTHGDPRAAAADDPAPGRPAPFPPHRDLLGPRTGPAARPPPTPPAAGAARLRSQPTATATLRGGGGGRRLATRLCSRSAPRQPAAQQQTGADQPDP
ncbi:basic proline-rich protein-like, partial [Penaeus monodon]|uniref:basic proline-rich protein-like n=1 Tax=Penaeus monodon TaxID=6687 RepID=UPI0018A75BD3